MPDFNLKGEESEWGSEDKLSRPRKRKWMWIALSLAVVLIAGVGGYALFESGRVQQMGEMPSVTTTNLESGHTSLGVIPALPETSQTSVAMGDSVSTNLTGSQDSAGLSAIVSENRVGENPMPVAPSTTSRRYTLQLSAWQSEAKANEEAARLQAHGLEAFISRSLPETSGRVWHRVRVGHFATVSDARKTAEAMVDSLVSGFTVEKDN